MSSLQWLAPNAECRTALILWELRIPKGIGIAELAIVAEQIGDGLAAIVIKIEQREPGRDRLSAEPPRL